MKRLLLALALAAAQFAAQGQAVPNPKATGISTATGSVSSAACTPSNGVTCSVSTATTTPTFAIGLGAITPSSVNGIVLSGTAATTMTFPTTSATLARTDAGNTFTGHQTIEGVTSTGATGSGLLVFGTSPALTTPNIGVATATSVNGLAISTSTGTLTVASSKTLTASATITLSGTDGTTYTLPTQSAKGVPWLGSSTFASLQTCNGTYSGFRAYVSDLGARGAEVYCDGSRWRALAGRVLLAQTTAASSAIANTETIALQGKVPAGFMATGDVVAFTPNVTKSGATDSCNFAVRAGTAGTTADANLTPSVITITNTSNLSSVAQLEFALVSATTAQRLGPVAGNGYFAAANTTAAQAAVTISSATSNALWWSFGISSSGVTNTCTVQSARLELITG